VRRNFRLKKSNEMQQNADIYLLLNYSTSFGRPDDGRDGRRNVQNNLAVNKYLLILLHLVGFLPRVFALFGHVM